MIRPLLCLSQGWSKDNLCRPAPKATANGAKSKSGRGHNLAGKGQHIGADLKQIPEKKKIITDTLSKDGHLTERC